MQSLQDFTRRSLLQKIGGTLGGVGLSLAMQQSGLLAETTRSPHQARVSHHKATAKSVIWLFMNGGPSSIDLFDPKPVLNKWHGKPFPGKIDALFPDPGPVYGSPYKSKKHGECGADVSELLPHLAKHVDDIAFLKACKTDSKNHGPASYQANTGMTRLGFPSAGAWATYGLGTENRDLPGYVVMYDRRSAPEGGPSLWGSGFLPSSYQAVTMRPGANPILYLNSPEKEPVGQQKKQLQLLQRLNQKHLEQTPYDEQLAARIESFELAYRMQMKAPGLVDLSKETKQTHALYGLDKPETAPFGTQLLLARRMVEKGVRFIQIYHGGATFNWDSHQELDRDHRKACRETDQPMAGLLADLKQRGLLDDTLVVWGGEFGRLPTSQNGNGRDHNPHAFSMWMAGGGVQGGVSHGETDSFGYKPIRDSVHINDIHATMLHLMGMDHELLTYPHNGRDMRLTGVAGNVIREIIQNG